MSQSSLATRKNTALDELERQLRHQREFPAILTSTDAGGAPLDWLARCPGHRRLFWRGRGDVRPIAAWGAVREVRRHAHESAAEVLERCADLLDGLAPGTRMFGGFTFLPEATSTSPEWRRFGTGRFWLPRLHHDGERLALTVLSPEDAEMAARDLEELRLVPHVEELPLPEFSCRSDLPTRGAWSELIEQAHQLFSEEALEKIVLVRRCHWHTDQTVPAMTLLKRLWELNLNETFYFFFQPGPAEAFLGATPERLFSRRGLDLETEIVAGTRRRGEDAASDERLAGELLRSTKDQLEHDIVRKSIRQRLHGCSESVRVAPQASLVRLRSAQHLYSHVRARLRPGTSDGDLIERLHPTPALGGYPRENALAEITRLEAFDRGWYGAPVGWMERDASEFVVAIRSALVDDKGVYLFSGAGIVPGSDADQEWHEIESKTRDLREILVPTDASEPFVRAVP